MLDLRALVDGTGSTSPTTLSTIATNDGSNIAGVPLIPGGVLAFLAFDQLVAGTPFVSLKMLSTDLPDPSIGLDFGTSYPPDALVVEPMVKYVQAAIQPNYDQTAAARLAAYLHWWYPNASKTATITKAAGKPLTYNANPSACVAGAWVSSSVAPATFPQNSEVAILGCRISAITKRCAIRFTHADWGAYKPGFFLPQSNLAVTINEVGLPWPFLQQGRQFEALSSYLGTPEVPVFRAGSNTGLSYEILSNTADASPALDIVYKVLS